MNWKTVAVIIIIIAALGGGAFYAIKKNQTTALQSATGQQTGDASKTVQAQDTSIGTGAEAKPGMSVSVLYVGKLPDGTVFDSSAMHDNQPLTFVLGSQGLIPGFQIGVNGMKEGGERVMAVPPELGYGSQDVKDQNGKVIIPANTTIVFDVKLVKVAPAEAAPASQQTSTGTAQ